MRFVSWRAMVGAALVAPFLIGCQAGPDFEIDYEMYSLDNGLSVVLHEDRSDPIAAVAVLYHVGSNREEVGRTGFAHLFEHMMFQSSQHVGEDQFFQKIQDAGGTLNGGTSSDQTIYFEVVPKNALEMALWLEADRLGYLLPTVTQEAFVNQQAVVQNEKRQGVDNRPYGHTNYVIDKLLFPEAHPYNWQVIGSFEDLANASVEDVRNFFRTWYGPNNATLVVAGDFDVTEAKTWIEKYFGEIPAASPTTDPDPQLVILTETKRAFHEDNFARSPELNMVFPTVQQFEADAYALGMLGELFSDGKKAPLYKVIVEEEKLAPSVSAYQRSREMAGSFRIRVRAFPGKSLTDVEAAIQQAFQRFEEVRFTEDDLDRIKAGFETGFYNGISSILGKSFQLARYNEYAGSPGFIEQDFQRALAVTSDDVWRVYEQYIKNKPFVLTSFVPKGQTDLVADGSNRFPVQEEVITAAGAEVGTTMTDAAPVADLPSSFDRAVEPPKGPSPTVTIPEVWTHTYANGLRLYGIEHHELPLVNYGLTIRGGHQLDDLEKVGVANLMTDIMMEGTATKTPLELEEAIDGLGANISMFTTDESIVIRANGLKSRSDAFTALFQEILLEPRWDETEFARIKDETIETINRRKVNPGAVASMTYNRLVYGDDHPLGHPTIGSTASVEAITIDDVKAFYEANYSPSVSYITIAGDITEAEAIALFQPLEEDWPARDVTIPEYAAPAPQPRPTLYFVDIPGAKQSQIYVGHVGLPRTHEDYHAATVMNHRLGGSFNSVVNLILREEKGYTYGARSRFGGGHMPGTFTASSSVRSNATYESVEIFRDEIAKYRQGISEDDLTFTKNALVQSNARRFETLPALLGMLDEIAMYGRPFDYVREQENVTRRMTLEQHRQLAKRYIDPDQMIYLVVGDAATQLGPLARLGLGTPVVLEVEGM
ncbi:MAG: insulinase family protein [Gemmatimonadota bacterium]|nr:insulinase family protein [Gemmatimonadota bacterium]